MLSVNVCSHLLFALKLLKSQSRFAAPLLSPTATRTMASSMAKRLEGKTIVVTGASSGIGKSTGASAASMSPRNEADAIQQWSLPARRPRVSS